MPSVYEKAGYGLQVFMVYYHPQRTPNGTYAPGKQALWFGAWFPLWMTHGYSPWDAARRFRLQNLKLAKDTKIMLRPVDLNQRAIYLRRNKHAK